MSLPVTRAGVVALAVWTSFPALSPFLRAQSAPGAEPAPAPASNPAAPAEKAPAPAPAPAETASLNSDWYLVGGKIWKSRQLPVDRFFQIRVNGQSAPFNTLMTEMEKRAGDEGPSPPRTFLAFTAVNLDVVREFIPDSRREALFILDTFTNPGDAPIPLQLDYTTPFSVNGGSSEGLNFRGNLAQNGEMREYGRAVPDGTYAAVIVAERQGTPALPLVIWGQPDAPWRPQMQAVSSALRFRYEGMVPAKGKVAFLHVIATAGLDPKRKLEDSFAPFLKEGRLLDLKLTPAEKALVKNFTPAALGGDAGESTPVEPGPARGRRLLALEGVLKRLEISKDRPATGLLWMNKEEQITGKIEVEKVVVQGPGTPLEIPAAEVAALSGGGSRGRAHRVYLRNGTVLAPVQVQLVGGVLKAELGDIPLQADVVEMLVWPTSAQDGQPPAGAGDYVQMQDGSATWLAPSAGPGEDLDLVTAFGILKLPQELLWTLQRRTEPPYCLVATLTDGSRIQGVLQSAALRREALGIGQREFPLSGLVRWSALEAVIKEMSADAGDSAPPAPAPAPAPAAPTPLAGADAAPGQYCWMREGSLLVGQIHETEMLRLRTPTGETQLKPDTIRRLAWEGEQPLTATVVLASGTKLKGEVLNETLRWKLGNQTLALPVGLMTEVVCKPQP